MDQYQNIPVMTDLFTKFAWAVPTLDQTAVTTARVLWNCVIQPFGCPERFHSNQGPGFESKLVQKLSEIYGGRKTHTTPNYPQRNGTCERFNQTLLNLLGTLDVEGQDQWASRLCFLTHAYNNSVHSSTGYAPTYLMFGQHVHLPVDLALGTSNRNGVGSVQEWVHEHHKSLTQAYNKVCQNLQRVEKNKLGEGWGGVMFSAFFLG